MAKPLKCIQNGVQDGRHDLLTAVNRRKFNIEVFSNGFNYYVTCKSYSKNISNSNN